MNDLSSRERRLIALLLLVLAIAAAWFTIAEPIVDGFAARAAEREQLAEEQVRGQRLIGTLRFWRSQAARQHATSAAFAMRAQNADAASELAKQRLLSVVLAQGGVVKTIHEQPGAPGEVRLRAELQLTLTQLTSSLRLIEDQKPYVIIEKLSIASDQAAVSGRLSPMDVSIDLGFPFTIAPS
jgi:hypothetical protein